MSLLLFGSLRIHLSLQHTQTDRQRVNSRSAQEDITAPHAIYRACSSLLCSEISKDWIINYMDVTFDMASVCSINVHHINTVNRL